MSSFTQHWVKTVHAHSFDYKKAPLQISLQTKYGEMPTEITLYLDNDALTKALVKAINETVAAHRNAEPVPDQDVIAAEPEVVF